MKLFFTFFDIVLINKCTNINLTKNIKYARILTTKGGISVKNNEFRVLSLKEERELSTGELKQYYKELREYVLSRKLTNTTPGATTIAPKLKKITNKIAVAVTKAFSDKNVEWICDGKENIPEGAVILAHTHQGILDGFLWIPHFDRHCIILHGSDVNKLLLACQLNTGLVLAKKEDKDCNNIKKNNDVREYNHNAKLDMIKLLLEGHSISWYPEGTWNLSPNKLHLPMSFGFLDAARKANVPVIPVVHEFTYESDDKKEKISKIHSRYGKPIYITQDDDIEEKLEEYKTAISTMRWELIEEKGTYSRKTVSNQDYINYLKGNYKNLKLGKLNVKMERDNIYAGNQEFYEFHHINDIPFDEEGNLLETEEVRRLTLINKKHGIGV